MLLRSLAAIGLVGDDGLPNAELVVRVAAEPGETFATTVGTYKRVSLEGGAVVWIDIGAPGTPQAGQVIGMTPFHDCVGAVEVDVLQALAIDGDDPLVGSWSVVLPTLARGDRPLPVTLEIVPFRLQPPAATTFKAHLRVLGLATEATVYPSPAAYLDRAPKAKLVALGGVSPVPAGSAFPAAGEQRCVALVTGRIEECRQLVNPISRQPYFWLVLQTDRGRFNLAANGRTLLGAAPVPGAIVQAKARLVATPVGADVVAMEPVPMPPSDQVRSGGAGPRTASPPAVTVAPPAESPGPAIPPQAQGGEAPPVRTFEVEQRTPRRVVRRPT